MKIHLVMSRYLLFHPKKKPYKNFITSIYMISLENEKNGFPIKYNNEISVCSFQLL